MTNENEFDHDFSDDIEIIGGDVDPALLADEAHGEPGEEGWEAEDALDPAAEDAALAKRRRTFKFVLGGVGGVVVLFILLQLMSSPNRQAAAPSTDKVAVVQPPPTPQDVIYGGNSRNAFGDGDQNKPATDKTTEGGLLNSPDALKTVETNNGETSAANGSADNASGNVSAPATAVPVAAVPVAAVPDTAAPVTPVVVAPVAVQPATQQPLTPLPAPASAAATVPAPVATVPVTAAPVVATAPVAVAAVSRDDLARLATRLDAIDASLKSLQNMTASKSDLSAVQSQVATLQQHVERLAQTPAPAPVTAAVTAVAPSNSPVKVEAYKAPVSYHWTLRSAQPGAAVVAGRDGQLKTVHPGDNLPGVGKIYSIIERNGSWLVQGSEGQVAE